MIIKMKGHTKYILTIIVLWSTIQNSIAQESYNSIIKEGARWLERRHHGISREVNITTDYELRLTDIDTTINDKKYKVIQILYRIQYSGINQAPPSFNNLKSDIPAKYWASIREEDKRVYIHQDEDEHLVYDFNLDEGDSLSTYFFLLGGHITKVDIVVIREISRKRFHIAYRWGSETYNYFIYEGIGSSFGLFPSAPFPTAVELVCHSNYQTQEVYYLSEHYDQCYEMNEFTTATSQAPAHSKSIIYPNPSSNYLQIRNDNDHWPLLINLLSLNGKTIMSEVLSKKVQTVDIRSLNPGLYILEIVGSNRREVHKIQKM